ncbi:hypothetical protein OG21DRAFT_1488647 [Imleria badia]|nr:hypothetical protein OG21DRAFT_1488647 [Imleria badia]
MTASSAAITSTNSSLVSPDTMVTLTDPSRSCSSPIDAISASTESSHTSLEKALQPVIVNPVVSLGKKSLKIKIPALPPLPANVADKKNVGQGNNEGERGSGSSAGKRKGATSRKMCPTKNRTGYNLCAIRWLAQVNENGSSKEFRIYWNQELIEAYKNEAKELVDNNTWNDAVSAGPLH